MSPRVSGTTICCSKNPLQVSFQPPAPRLTPFLQSLQASSKEAKELFLPCKDPLALVRPTVQREDRAEEEETGPLATSSSDNMDPCDDDPVLKPSLMPFDTMCRELQAWRARFGTCHVPRRCFDAAELGAWVRYIRRKYRRRTLETWKADCLNLLSFCWEVSREDGRWYANMHHLRHFKALHLAEAEARLQSIESLSTSESSSGLFEITALSVGRIGGSDLQPFDDGVHGAWRELSKWVQDQGKLLTAGQLPLQKQQALASVGITLRVDMREVERNVQLQGLNAHERRLIRKKWRKEDSSERVIEAPTSKSKEVVFPRNNKALTTFTSGGDKEGHQANGQSLLS